MAAMKGFFRLLHRQPLPMAGVLAVCLAIILVFVDWITWIELNEAIVYSLPLVLAAMARSRRLLWVMTFLLFGTIFAVYAVQIQPGVFSCREPLFINRVLAAVTLLITAGLLHVWTVALDALDEQGLALKAHNEQLDSANRQLHCKQEEISHKNEELERLRREAEEASGRKTRLLASVSHDMRSPLQVLNLTAELILRTADDQALTGEVSEWAQLLQTNALGLADLVSDVLDISSIESGRVELRESEFSVEELLAEECRQMLPLAQAKNITLVAESSAPATWIRTDRVKLARILSNLISNALKFTESGGVTLSSCFTPERDVLIRVQDTGIGISTQHLVRIFDEFAQLPNPERDSPKGWGLGLAICRRLIELLGGTITVESQLNHGTAFSVRLPSSCVVNNSESGPDQTTCSGELGGSATQLLPLN